MKVAILCCFLMNLAQVLSWTGEIKGRVVCDVCRDSVFGAEDYPLEGAEVAVLCITKSGEVMNYQSFTDNKGVYSVAETMAETDKWDTCVARPLNSFNQQCSRLGDRITALRFTYNRPSAMSHILRPFLYSPHILPIYCT